ncbi:MAG: hypothetical protein RSG50_07635 [Clostridia bacterium]
MRELESQREQVERAQKGPKTIHRWKLDLYSKIKVSVTTMNVIILVVVSLIVLALVVGIILGG